MSEGTLYRLSQQLRLLARSTVVLTEDGRKLHGEINAEVENARLHLEEMIDQLMDGQILGDLQRRHVDFCRELVRLNRPAIHQLELDVCPF
jgi:hypothetical protein